MSAQHRPGPKERPTHPFVVGDWVATNDRVAKVKSVDYDDIALEPIFDLIPYNANGERIGRWSDPCGGPRSYEPCCSMDGWRRIEEPVWPLGGNYAGSYKPSGIHFIDDEPPIDSERAAIAKAAGSAP